MQSTRQKITPFLWFDSEAEDAARYYISIFRNATMGTTTHYGKEGFEIHGKPEGSVMTVSFRIEGQEFVALNGGPVFKFNEAVSFVVVVIHRKKSIIIGKNCLRAATKTRNSAAG
jgi:predicted 3-demethylubiquinone-9 3-methyltransferase (glyoxalase superfamily)